MRRYELSDRQWEVVSPLLSGKASDCGVTAIDNRLFFNAVVWILRTGAPWADLPARFGLPNSVCRRFRRLAQKGVWEQIFSLYKRLIWSGSCSILPFYGLISTPPAKKK